MIICDGIAHVADLVNDNLTESKVGRTKDSLTLSTDLFDLALLGIQSRGTTHYVLAPASRPLVNVLLVSLIPIASWFVFRLLLDPSPSLAAVLFGGVLHICVPRCALSHTFSSRSTGIDWGDPLDRADSQVRWASSKSGSALFVIISEHS